MDEHALEQANAETSAEACRFCGGSLLTSVFDTSFRDTAAEERLFFAIPGALWTILGPVYQACAYLLYHVTGL